MLYEEIPFIWIILRKTMTVITFISFIRACGSVEPCFFVAYFFIMFPTAVSSFHPVTVIIIFLYVMGRVRIIIRYRKESWWTRRGVQSTNIIFRGNRNGSWKQIWIIVGYFIQAVSIINSNGSYIKRWDTTIIWKGITREVMNLPIVLLSHWNFLSKLPSEIPW